MENFLINLATVSFSKMAVLHTVDMKIMDRVVTTTQIHELINSVLLRPEGLQFKHETYSLLLKDPGHIAQ